MKKLWKFIFVLKKIYIINFYNWWEKIVINIIIFGYKLEKCIKILKIYKMYLKLRDFL